MEVAADSPEAAALLAEANSSEETRDTKEKIERIQREAQGARVPVDAVLNALFPPVAWREGDRLFIQAS